jgi:hypothetical protein
MRDSELLLAVAGGQKDMTKKNSPQPFSVRGVSNLSDPLFPPARFPQEFFWPVGFANSFRFVTH